MTDRAAATPKRWVIDTSKPARDTVGTDLLGSSYDDAGNPLPRPTQPSPHATHTLATLRAWHDQPVPDWDALIAEQDAREAARYQATPLGRGWDDLLHNPWDAPATPPATPAPPTAATAMPARALCHARRTGWEEVR